MIEFKRILPAFLVVLGGFLILYLMMIIGNKLAYNYRMDLIDSGRYSITKIDRFVNEPRASYYIYYFEYKNKSYKGRFNFERKYRLKQGKTYFVLFNPSKPSKIPVLIQTFSVPDSITKAPPEGWKEIPIPINMEEVRKYLESGKND